MCRLMPLPRTLSSLSTASVVWPCPSCESVKPAEVAGVFFDTGTLPSHGHLLATVATMQGQEFLKLPRVASWIGAFFSYPGCVGSPQPVLLLAGRSAGSADFA